jgi:hypothetical protein
MPETRPQDPLKYADSKPAPIGAPAKQADSRHHPLLAALARLYWLLVGNGLLCLLALAIAQQGHERAWTADAAFWTVVASLILVRYLDIARLGGTAATREPASLRDWYLYARRLVLLALAVWIVAHAVPLIGLPLGSAT